jgi:hypothetical protein
MRCRTSLSQAKGSTLLSFAVAMTEQTVAHRTPPRAGTLPGFQDGMAIGQHGSWNRSRLSGYKVVFALFANGRPAGPPRDILTGFLAPERADIHDSTGAWGAAVPGPLVLTETVKP